jgi:hypothetical protein
MGPMRRKKREKIEEISREKGPISRNAGISIQK